MHKISVVLKNHHVTILFPILFALEVAQAVYWKTHPDQMLHITYGFSQKNRMDEFSSKTGCVMALELQNQNSGKISG